ncbi:hypothetical protein CVU75_01320 [Candidatus Dependentiae bacterium HGW-Dependentiae-1]|nr:MAG: hypothetical protein CVU75_01320 [Candidatus Dependentiae bacterium HGW-Dependentiae-1]
MKNLFTLAALTSAILLGMQTISAVGINVINNTSRKITIQGIYPSDIRLYKSKSTSITIDRKILDAGASYEIQRINKKGKELTGISVDQKSYTSEELRGKKTITIDETTAGTTEITLQ